MGHTLDLDYRLWDYYLLDCRANSVRPRLDDFVLWKSEQDYDLEPEEERGYDAED